MAELDITAVVADPRSGIVPALMFFGALLKSTRLNNRYIPLLVTLAGMGLGIVFYYPAQNIAASMFIGFMYAAVAIGLHSGTKNSFEQRNKPPSA